MKILDIKRKGNIVNFFLGEDSLSSWAGPKWECKYSSAELVDPTKVKSIKTVVFNFSLNVTQPMNGPFIANVSKNDMVQRKVPLLTISDLIGMKDYDIFMGDTFENLPTNLIFTIYDGI